MCPHVAWHVALPNGGPGAARVLTDDDAIGAMHRHLVHGDEDLATPSKG